MSDTYDIIPVCFYKITHPTSFRKIAKGITFSELIILLNKYKISKKDDNYILKRNKNKTSDINAAINKCKEIRFLPNLTFYIYH